MAGAGRTASSLPNVEAGTGTVPKSSSVGSAKIVAKGVKENGSTSTDSPEIAESIDDNRPWGKLASLNEELGDFFLTEQKVVIGRHRDCTLRVQGPLISGRHCTISRQLYDGGENIECFFLLDTSSNGTFLDGEIIGRGIQRVIKHGSKIAFPWRPEQVTGVDEKLPDKLIVFEFQKLEQERSADWAEVEAKYEIGELLGSGAFAVVKKVIDKETNQAYAMKIVDKKKMALVQTDRKDILMTEVELLKKLNHPNILKLYEVFDTPATLFMVLELVNGGDLYDTLKKAGRLPETYARPIFGQLLAAIYYMHSKNVSHRDLKPENVLVQRSPSGKIQVKLSDFGLSRATKTDQTLMQTMAGTLDYCAPEIITHYHTGNGYGREVDMWSLGVILYIMLSGIAPFGQGQQAKQLLDDIIHGHFTFPERRFGDVSEEAKDLICQLLVPDPHVRWTAKQALEHTWIREPEES